jgi:hypothetical protein
VRAGPWSREEDSLLVSLVESLGPKWTEISSSFSGRSANAIKNRYHLQMREKVRTPSPDPPLARLLFPPPGLLSEMPAIPRLRCGISQQTRPTEQDSEKVGFPSIFSLLNSS